MRCNCKTTTSAGAPGIIFIIWPIEPICVIMRLWSIKSLKSNLLAIMRLARRSASVLDTDFSAFSTRLKMSPAGHRVRACTEFLVSRKCVCSSSAIYIGARKPSDAGLICCDTYANSICAVKAEGLFFKTGTPHAGTRIVTRG